VETDRVRCIQCTSVIGWSVPSVCGCVWYSYTFLKLYNQIVVIVCALWVVAYLVKAVCGVQCLF